MANVSKDLYSNNKKNLSFNKISQTIPISVSLDSCDHTKEDPEAIVIIN